MTTNPYIALHLAITAGLWLLILNLIYEQLDDLFQQAHTIEG